MPELSGTKWGSHLLGTAGGVVTWSIAPSGQDIYWFTDEDPGTSFSVDPASVYTFDVEAALRLAFAEWSRYGDIEFLQVQDPGGAAGGQIDPDIRIFFAPIPGNTLGFAFVLSLAPRGAHRRRHPSRCGCIAEFRCAALRGAGNPRNWPFARA